MYKKKVEELFVYLDGEVVCIGRFVVINELFVWVVNWMYIC